jgi:hypothetical protein
VTQVLCEKTTSHWGFTISTGARAAAALGVLASASSTALQLFQQLLLQLQL